MASREESWNLFIELRDLDWFCCFDLFFLFSNFKLGFFCVMKIETVKPCAFKVFDDLPLLCFMIMNLMKVGG